MDALWAGKAQSVEGDCQGRKELKVSRISNLFKLLSLKFEDWRGIKACLGQNKKAAILFSF